MVVSTHTSAKLLGHLAYLYWEILLLLELRPLLMLQSKRRCPQREKVNTEHNAISLKKARRKYKLERKTTHCLLQEVAVPVLLWLGLRLNRTIDTYQVALLVWTILQQLVKKQGNIVQVSLVI